MELLPEEFISLSRHILRQNNGKPSQVALRRALITAYYALFHTLARVGADLLIGEASKSRGEDTWRQVYRGLNHRQARKFCAGGAINKFPPSIQNFGRVFVEMQRIRNSADYDPYAGYEKPFTKTFVEYQIDLVERTIADFNATDKKDRKAFSARVLFKNRTSV